MPGYVVNRFRKLDTVSSYWGNTVMIAIDELQDVPWEPFPFLAPWTHWNDVAVSNAGFRLLGDKVYLRGLARRNGAAGNRIGTLPAGYRPATSSMFAMTSANIPSGFCRVDIYGDGNVDVSVGQTLADSYVSLDGIFFSTTT